MSQQKYRYYFQHEETGHITFKEYELEEIESYDGIQIPHRYFITARCQFTGLLSKNGVEIYEGDIVKTNLYNINGLVYYSSPSFGIKQKNGICTDYNWSDFNNFEVIGNIYENKELWERI